MREKWIFFGLVCVIFFCGCAALMALIDEGKQIDRKEVAPVAGSFDVLLGDMIPAPYRLPATYVLGWLSCLLRRVYKKKQGSLG